MEIAPASSLYAAAFSGLFPLLRILLESFALILLGGIFILGEASLKAEIEKESEGKSVHLYRLRPFFRFVAILIFIFTAVMATDTFDAQYSSLQGWMHLLTVMGVFLVLTLMILLFGIVLPRALGASLTTSIVARIIWPIAQAAMLAIRPVALIVEKLATWFLSYFGLSLHVAPPASEKKVIHILDEGLHSGVFNASEKKMVERVLDLNGQTVGALMTPRSQFVWLNLDDTEEKNWRCIAKSGHSEFPVFQGTHDRIAGMISVKSLWANISLTGSVKLSDVVAAPLYVPKTMTAVQLIEEFREKKRHMALVVDEFGAVEGIITVKDIFEAIVGILPEREVKQHYPKLSQREDNSWLIDAGLDFKKTCEALKMDVAEPEEENRYQTIGGFFLHHLGHVPRAGEFILWKNFRFEVLKMNKHRIEQLLVKREG